MTNPVEIKLTAEQQKTVLLAGVKWVRPEERNL